MRRADRLRVLRRRTKKDNDLAIVVLINIGKADPFAVRSKGEVIIRHQQLAVGRAICPAVQFHLLAKRLLQMGNDGLLGNDADRTRLLGCRKGLGKGDFGDSLGGGSRSANDLDCMIENGVIARLGKACVRNDAVPIVLLILGEGAAAHFGMIGDQSLHVRLIQFDQGHNLPLVRLVNVGKANALPIRGKSEVIVRKKKLSVRRAVRSAVEFHVRSVFAAQIGDDRLFGNDALCACRCRRRDALGQGARLHGNDDGSNLPRLQLANAIVQSGDLLVFFQKSRGILFCGIRKSGDLFVFLFEIGTRSAVFFFCFGGSSLQLCKHSQADKGKHAECDQHGEDHVDGDQGAVCGGSHNVHNIKISHCSIPPLRRSAVRPTMPGRLPPCRRPEVSLPFFLSLTFFRRSRSRRSGSTVRSRSK